jgi:glycosyltransferase involved in cell wall biosynthesis
VRGPFRGPSGYDHHVREFVRELHAQGVAIQLVDLPEWSPVSLAAEQRDPWFETLERPVPSRVVLQFCMPHQALRHRGRIDVNYTMFEATRVPAQWVAANRRLGLLVVPTASSQRAWIDSGLPAEQIRVCPLGVNPRTFGPPAEPLVLRDGDGESIQRYRVRFLNVAELGPRKNLVGLLRVWLQATSRQDDAALILKLGVYAPGWTELLQLQLERMQRELGKHLEEAAPILTVQTLYSDAEMPRLYAAATHYLSLSHGEGWDQAMVEAAASGLRLIAPRHSAYNAYLDDSIATLIDSREVPAVFIGDPLLQALFAGAHWWQPDERQAIEAVRAAIDGRDGGTASARERILRDFTWQQATSRLRTLLDEAQQRPPRRAWLPFGWPRR